MIYNLATGKNKSSITVDTNIELTRVYIEPTTACNLSCQTCVRNTWSEPMGSMSMSTFETVLEGIKQFPSIERVALWGIGEPTLHPELHKMIAAIKKCGTAVEIITNGMLLTSSLAEKLVDAGLDRLIVSIDSISDVKFAEIRTGATLSTVLENVKKINRIKLNRGSIKPEIGVEFTLMKKNLSELNDLRGLALELEANQIIVTNLLPYSEDQKNEILYWNSATENHQQQVSKWNPEINLPRIDIQSETTPHLGKLSFEALNYGANPPVSKNYHGVCPFVERGSVAINWQGEVSPCVPLMHSYACYVLGRKKNIVKHSFGNINYSPLKDIWEHPNFIKFRNKIMNNEFSPCVECGGCDMNLSNEEDCFGNTHPTCGDCLWAKGVIQCP